MKYVFSVLIFLCIPLALQAQSKAVYIEAIVAGCGNSIIEIGEVCDGLNLNGQSCSTLGYGAGSLGCSSSCTLVTASCVVLVPPVSNISQQSNRFRPVATHSFVVRGKTIPNSRVIILRDGTRVAEGISTRAGEFQVPVVGLLRGVYQFSVQVESADGLRTGSFTFPYYIAGEVTMMSEEVFVGPTVDISQSTVVSPQALDVYGAASPGVVITIIVYQAGKALRLATTTADVIYGRYALQFSTLGLTTGDYMLLSYASAGRTISPPSRVIQFTVGHYEIPRRRDFDSCPFIRGDINSDCRVDERDIFLARSWLHGQRYSSLLEIERLSGDNRITMKDFSIIFYYWTG